MLVSQFNPQQKIYVGSWYLLGKQHSSSSAATGVVHHQISHFVRELATQNTDTGQCCFAILSTPSLPALPTARQHCSSLQAHGRGFQTKMSKEENHSALCSTAEVVNKQQLKSNEIWIIWFSFFKWHISIA